LETINSSEKDEYTTILGVSRWELNAKKSRFIGLASSVLSEKEAMDFIHKAKLEIPAATHYCYAFSIGTGSKIIVRSNDDGEPINSAGKPILQAIEHSKLYNLICIVVRYFGGIKLGIGGLIRAYGQTARDCINNANKTICISYAFLEIMVPSNHIGTLVNFISRSKGRIINLEYNENARFTIQIRTSMIPILKENAKAIGGDILITNIS